jgi:hypothetical protein
VLADAAFEVHDLLAVATIVLCAVALGALALGWVVGRPRRITPARPTMELGDEPPAIVDLLTSGWAPTSESVPATLLDLAHRGWLAVEEPVPGTVLVRLRNRPPSEPLLPYEERVLDQVRAVAVDGAVPAEALTTGPVDASRRWWRRLRAEIIADARARGFARNRLPVGLHSLANAAFALAIVTGIACLWPVMFGSLDEVDRALRGYEAAQQVLREGGSPQEAAAAADAARDTDPVVPEILLAAGAVGGLAAAGFAVGAVAARHPQRDTPAGRAAAARWLGVREYLADQGEFADTPAAAVVVWGRYLPHAVALSLAPRAARELPLGAESTRVAWSRAQGRWRPVRIRYPRLVPGRGLHPAALVADGLVIGFVAVVLFLGMRAGLDAIVDADLGPDPSRLARLGLGIAAAVAVAGIAFASLRVVVGVIDLFARRTVRGVVLRNRGRATFDPSLFAGVGRTGPLTRWLAIDEARSDRVVAFAVGAPVRTAAPPGATVELVVSPLLGHVWSLTTLDRP